MMCTLTAVLTFTGNKFLVISCGSQKLDCVFSRFYGLDVYSSQQVGFGV